MIRSRPRRTTLAPPRRRTDRRAAGLRTTRSLPRRVPILTAQLLRLAEELRRSRHIEATLHAVTRVSVVLTRSLQGTLRLLDESGKRLLASARTGPSVHRRGAAPFRLGEGFIGWVAVHHRPALTNRVGRDPRFVVRRGQVWTPSGLLAVPLLVRQECIGVLSASRRDGSAYRRTDLEVLRLIAELSVPYLEIARLKRLNESDPLTLLHNRRHLEERLPLQIEKAQRDGTALAVAALDLDHFKKVNDSHGHPVGDQVLIELAERLRQACRSTDVLARVGGEEFLILLPETNLRQARGVAERIRRQIAETPFLTAAGPVSITASLGVARRMKGEGGASLQARADRALYRAKRAGRNRVEAAGRD
jgi:diguanylate cyclase (GGDEF)-like protein